MPEVKTSKKIKKSLDNLIKKCYNKHVNKNKLHTRKVGIALWRK